MTFGLKYPLNMQTTDYKSRNITGGLQNDVHQIVKFQLLSSQPNADGKLGEALYSNGILAYP